MFSKRILRIFLKSNLYPNRITLSKYSSGLHISENVLPFENTAGEYKKINHFKNYILKSSNFKNPVLEISELNFSVDNKHESLKLLFQLKENPDNENLFQEMMNSLNKEVKTFELEDFLKAMALAGSCNFKSNSLYRTFLTCLSVEILDRKYTLDELLEILFVLKHSPYMKKNYLSCKFYYKVTRKLQTLQKLETSQAVQLFYYTEKLSKELKKAYGFHLHKYAKENLSAFNIDEMVIIFQGLNKAKVIRADIEFVKSITNKTLKEIDSLSSLHLNKICKFLEFSSTELHSVPVSDFQEQLIPHLSKFNSGSLLSALYSNFPYSINLNLWNNLKGRFLSEIKSLSTVECKRISELLASFNIKAEGLLKLAIEEVEARSNFHLCNPHNITFCKNVILHGLYPEKLLGPILSKEFVERLIQRSFPGETFEWAFVNYSLRLDKPELSVSLDPTEEKKIMSRPLYVLTHKKKVLGAFNVRLKLWKLLKNIYGEDKVLDGYCLPHFKRGIIMRFDRNLNALPIPQEFKDRPREVFKKPTDDQIWLCMNLCIPPPDNLGPFLETYVRHLIAIGFKPVLVHQKEFLKKYVLRNQETTAYVENLVQTALEKALQDEQNA